MSTSEYISNKMSTHNNKLYIYKEYMLIQISYTSEEQSETKYSCSCCHHKQTKQHASQSTSYIWRGGVVVISVALQSVDLSGIPSLNHAKDFKNGIHRSHA